MKPLYRLPKDLLFTSRRKELEEESRGGGGRRRMFGSTKPRLRRPSSCRKNGHGSVWRGVLSGYRRALRRSSWRPPDRRRSPFGNAAVRPWRGGRFGGCGGPDPSRTVKRPATSSVCLMPVVFYVRRLQEHTLHARSMLGTAYNCSTEGDVGETIMAAVTPARPRRTPTPDELLTSACC